MFHDTRFRCTLLGWLLVIAVVKHLPAQVPMDTSTAVRTVGVLNFPRDQVFGRINGIAADSLGNLFILDGLGSELSWFDEEGRLRGRVGPGAGPGELAAPMDLALDDRGRLHVLDLRNLRISTYEKGEDGLRSVADARISLRTAMGICTLGDRRFLLGFSPEGVLHEVDESGAILRSFGPPESPPQYLIDDFPGRESRWFDDYNRGQLACDAASGTIVLLSERLPLVRAFTADGEPLWRTALPDFHEVRWIPLPGRGARMGPDPETGKANTGVAIALLEGRRLVVTIHEGSAATSPEGDYEARVLELADGSILSTAATVGSIASIIGDRVYTYTNLPYPRVVVY